VTELLLEKARSRDPRVREECARELAEVPEQLSSAVTHLARMLSADRDEGVRASAASALGALGSVGMVDSEYVIDQLIEALYDKDQQVRGHAATALGRLAWRGERALPYLLDIVANTKESKAVRARALHALAFFGAHAKEAIPYFQLALRDMELFAPVDAPNGKTSLALIAANALEVGNLRPIGRALVPDLIRCLDVPNVRSLAIGALGKLGQGHEAFLPAIRKVLGAGDAGLATGAASALRYAGREAAPLIPDLLACLASTKRHESDAAANARLAIIATLGEIGPDPRVIQQLTAILKDTAGDVGERRQAAFALKHLGIAAKDALSPLCAILSDEKEDPSLKQAVVPTLSAMGSDVVPTLVKVAAEHPCSRSWIVYVLWGMGPAAKTSLPFLRELRDRDEQIPVLERAILRIERAR